MDDSISDFLTAQTCATVCMNDEIGSPYCFNCFYVFDVNEVMIYFKSSPDSCHAQLFEAEKAVAGTILPDKLNTLLPQGVQFQGTLLEKKHSIFVKASKQYYKHHPLALAKSGEIWIIRLDKIKMTDNSKGFGTKIHWQRHT